MTQATPMMQQWEHCKQQAEGQLLLFRMGDFYEAFYEDAQLLSQLLDLTLTQRGGIPMAGIPWHAAEHYLERLVAAGHKVAIAEQLEDPKHTKGLVKRGIVRVVTPGTWLFKEGEKAGQYMVALFQAGSLFGLAMLDMTTGTFQAGELESETDLINELYRLAPKEIIVSKSFATKNPTLLQEYRGVTVLPTQAFEYDHAFKILTDHFAVLHLDGFGLKGLASAVHAAGALLGYVQGTLRQSVDHIGQLMPYSLKDVMTIDRTTLRNLELIESVDPAGPTLLKTIDVTLTPMGGRLIREWIKRPLTHLTRIQARQEAVELLVHSDVTRSRLRTELRAIADLERLVMKIASQLATARDLQALAHSLRHIYPIALLLEGFASPALERARGYLSDFSDLTELLGKALVDEPPARIGEGRLFREGYHARLDELHQLTQDSRGWLAHYQAKIKEETGIKNLKITYNKVFGYTIEVSKGQAHLAPSSFERRQTLANAERFVSEELKQYEHQVLTAEEHILELDKRLFFELTQKVLAYQSAILQSAKAIASIDVTQCLAEIARKFDYVKPKVDESDCLEIEQGRHPVIEQRLEMGQFIPNDLSLGAEQGRMMLLTGPNMAGKSTFIRQVALITILAQMGSFVPAKRAHVGLIDKIFTRIGASDDLARGQSTFMVEMSETANILRNATSRSLVILDEIGRGTSTYDGVAIAWAVAEYLLMTEQRQAKTLFATHYWELTELSKHFSEVVNAHATVEERGDGIVFCHRIALGAADRSYGIHVAQLAGLPPTVIKRASEILKKLETKKGKSHEPSQSQQLLLF